MVARTAVASAKPASTSSPPGSNGCRWPDGSFYGDDERDALLQILPALRRRLNLAQDRANDQRRDEMFRRDLLNRLARVEAK
jgi:hypothetical protein